MTCKDRDSVRESHMKTALLSALVLAGLFAFAPSGAQASDFGIRIGGGFGGVGFGIRIGDDSHRHHDGCDRHYDQRHCYRDYYTTVNEYVLVGYAPVFDHCGRIIGRAPRYEWRCRTVLVTYDRHLRCWYYVDHCGRRVCYRR